MKSILSDIEDQGFSLQQDLFTSKTLMALRENALNAYHNNSLKKAGISRAGVVEEKIRGDYIYWLTEENLTEHQKVVWDFLCELKECFNKTFYLGLKNFETHLTVYPPDTSYKKHIDQFKNSTEKARKVSFILYLNSDWAANDGGELLLYNKDDQIIDKILPTFGKMIFFLSEEFPHEVLKTQKERVSLTGWFFT